MLQKKLMQTLGFMFGGGLLGMIVAYILFGHTAGDYLSLRSIFFNSGMLLENSSPSLPELDAMRNSILAGGVAGMLTGLLFPAIYSHLQNRI